MRRSLLALALLFFLHPALFAQEARLLRFPTIHGDQVVFTYAANLYTVPAKGGIARKLTNSEGVEIFARLSPDGKQLAFTGQYDGNTEVYVMPAEGGVPKRLTFTATLGRDDVSDRMGPNNLVIGWKNNDEILFRSRMRDPNSFIGQLFTVSAKGGLPRQVPVPRGGFASYSPDGNSIAYNRIFREFRTWKRYRGGMADDIWVYNFITKKLDNITDNPAGDIIPMWSGNKIYFLSDRDPSKRFNLYVYDQTTKKTRQLTQFADWDVKYPSLGDNAIVFENAGYIYRFDLGTEKLAKIPVQIREDLVAGRTELRNVKDDIHAYEIAPDGKRALFSARGDIFTVPAKDGPTRNLTATPGVHDRNPKWSPDGKYIAYISDATGEDEIWIVPQDGSGAASQITAGGPPYKYALYWSPDSKKIVWADKSMKLFYTDVKTKKTKVVDESKAWEFRQYNWSPDSKWIAYTRYDEKTLRKVWLYSLEQNKSFAVTDGWYESYEAVFSGDGKYLFFVSDRDFNPTYSSTEWNHSYSEMSRIYFATLAKKTPSPFKEKSDEVEINGDSDKENGKDDDKKEDKKDKKKDGKAKDITVDIDGLSSRILRLQVPAANYRSLASVGSDVYYIRTSRKQPKAELYFYDLAKNKETLLGAVSGYEISADGKKMLVHKGNTYAIIGLPKSTINISDSLDLGDMQVKLDHHKEWNQIFHECWRQMRDFFYDPNMHGVDWKATRARYEPLLKHVNHRIDLSYIIGEMISEINAGHCYVGGGEYPKARRIKTGLLGAELQRDDKTRYYRIAKILKGANWDPSLRSPLTEIGVDVNEGDYIIAVNGQPTNEMSNIYEALLDTVGKQVRLKVNKAPVEKGSHEVVVKPIGDEHDLYYYNWVQANIKKVSDATGGKVGYLHIPDMLSDGLNEFAKHFYPQLRKKALIIDVRGNGGGNVSPQIIERLRRKAAMFDMARNTMSYTDPADLLFGPMTCIMNEFSASDGDLFPYRFRHYKLGKLIGKRSWGGVIGIRGSLPLLDGGTLHKPEFAPYSLDGKKWIIEGYGVDPDIVVDNHPGKEFAGIDQQLDRAIEVIMQELRDNERRILPPPPFPKR